MVLRSVGPAQVRAPADTPRPNAEGTRIGDRESELARSALAFTVRCHSGRWSERDGTQFIEHPLAVARLLRDAGCSAVLVAAGLLHDVVEDLDISVLELKARFGADVADLVQAVSDDASAEGYRRRKQAQRERIGVAGADAALLFAADNIADVRELPVRVMRDRARVAATSRHSRARNRVEHYHEMRLEHYRASLAMLQRVASRHVLVMRLAKELDDCAIALADGQITGWTT